MHNLRCPPQRSAVFKGLIQTKGLLLALLQEAYQQRAHAALLCFGGQGLQWRLNAQRPPAWNDAWLAPIGGGGHSPLAQTLSEADHSLQRAQRYAPAKRTLWLLSDEPRAKPARDAQARCATATATATD